jgi:IclR family mhp operon transcriptional activator
VKPFAGYVALGETQTMIERKVKSVRALERGLNVLFEIRRSRAASLKDLHQSTGLPKATLLRMLLTLSKHGLVWQRLADGAFLPSRLHGEAGWPTDRTSALAELASPHLAELRRRVAWPSVLAAPRLDHVEIIETNSAIDRLDSAMLGPIGVKLSYIHTATGRAYLAACDPDERAAIINRIRPNDADPASIVALDRILLETKARGYSERDPPHPWTDRNRSEVVTDGRRSIAVAIMAHGHAVGALNMTWPGHRMPVKEVIAQHLATLRRAAAAIGREVEGTPERPLPAHLLEPLAVPAGPGVPANP